jgi:YbbR domain-containing protein
VRDVPVQVRNATRPVQVQPRLVMLRVRGPGTTRNRSVADFDASVDVAGLGSGQYDLPVRIVPPTGVGVVSVTPSRVKVRIR